MFFRLTSQILDLEIQVMKANERNKTIEKKLLEKTASLVMNKTASLQNTRKELDQCKSELKKLKKSTDCLPIVHSELLKVISLLLLNYSLKLPM